MDFKLSPTMIAGIAIGALILLGLAISNRGSNTSPAVSDQNMNDESIKAYIEQHPEIILQSVEKYQERKTNEMVAQLAANIKAKKADLEQNPIDPRVGPDGATVKMVEFFDYGCVFCRKMQPVVAKAIQNNPDIQVIFKEMPMFGDASITAAKVGLAVQKLDPSKYYQFHTNLMRSQNSNNLSTAAMDTAVALGLNADKLKQAMQDPALDKIIEDNRKLATEIGVRGAPALVINGELFIGLMEVDLMQSKLDAAKGVKSEPAQAQEPKAENNMSAPATTPNDNATAAADNKTAPAPVSAANSNSKDSKPDTTTAPVENKAAQ